MKEIIKIIVFIFIFISCEKHCPIDEQNCPVCENDSINQNDSISHNDSTTNGVVSRFKLIVGDGFSDSVNYYEFDPYLSIRGRRTGVDTNYFYSDSVWFDLNKDSINDLYFAFYRSHFQPSCDCEEIDCCMPVDNASCWIKTSSKTEIAVGQYNMPIVLSMGDTLDNRYKWINYETKYGFSIAGMMKDWDTDQYNGYMGVRLITTNDTLFCWIRLNTHYSSKIDIYNYAIEK